MLVFSPLVSPSFATSPFMVGGPPFRYCFRIHCSELFCIVKEGIGKDEDVHRCCDKRCKEKKRWLVTDYPQKQFIDGGYYEKDEGHCSYTSESEQCSL